MEEIGRHFELRSPATIHQHLQALEQAGLIKRARNASRGITLGGPVNEGEIPLLGSVAAGRPIEAVLSEETVSVPTNMLGSGRTFALRVKGDSMIDEHIRDGDIIIVSSRQTAENGQTVVALIDGSDATVKKFYRERNSIKLEAANPKFDPLYIKPPQRVQVQGIVIGIIRYI
jgi:repressor LexA